MKRAQPLKRTGSSLRRSSRLRPLGRRGERDRGARKAFTEAIRARRYAGKWAGSEWFTCERCYTRARGDYFDPHHVCSVQRGRGLPLLHDPEANGRGLCRWCHDEIHSAKACPDRDDWLKTRRWLSLGGRLAEHDMEEEAR